jgi:hypothetical protein
MINLLEGYKGSLEVNGNAYNDLKVAVQALKELKSRKNYI